MDLQLAEMLCHWILVLKMAIVALLYCVMCMCCVEEMITDIQLAIFANVLGVSLFLLVVLYHYISVNNPKKSD